MGIATTLLKKLEGRGVDYITYYSILEMSSYYFSLIPAFGILQKINMLVGYFLPSWILYVSII